ncbi:hypothetical protein [Kitasatospora camelliae]|uniref:Uncharacterized protein n=1 Tax=Kitasatospora camelliae TaxID=3156397 RepID=A0AAU8JTW2_9ACTN
MATGVPQYRLPAAPRVPAGHAPALVPQGGEFDRLGAGGGRARPSDRPAPAPASVDRYDAVTVTVRHGLETVDILRLRRACGAVLQTAGGTAVTFLVPAGTADSWHLPGSICTPGPVLPSATDPRWLMPPAGPDATPRPTDAWVLRSALCEAACTLTAGGLGPF